MDPVPTHDLSERFWEHYALMSSASRRDRLLAEERVDAWEEVSGAMRARGADAVKLLNRLAWDAPDDDALSYLGAGPTEEFLLDAQPNDIASLTQAASKNARLVSALRSAAIPLEVRPILASQLPGFA